MSNYAETYNLSYFQLADLFDTRDLVDGMRYLEGSDDEFDIADLEALKVLAAELSNYAGDSLEDGNTVIADSYFKEYAIELASDLSSDIDAQRADSWPFCHIDWDAAAESLKGDYSMIEWEGSYYWIR